MTFQAKTQAKFFSFELGFSVYLTLSVTIERYFAIVHPLRHVGWKRALAPLSVLFAVAYNVPRFFEFYYDGEEGRIAMSALRTNDAYITYYVFWSKFIFIEIIPYFTIIVLNSFIIYKIYRSTQFRKSFRHGRSFRRTFRTEGNEPGRDSDSTPPEKRSTSEEEDGLDMEDKDIAAESGIALTNLVTAPPDDDRQPPRGSGKWRDACNGALFFIVVLHLLITY